MSNYTASIKFTSEEKATEANYTTSDVTLFGSYPARYFTFFTRVARPVGGRGVNEDTWALFPFRRRRHLFSIARRRASRRCAAARGRPRREWLTYAYALEKELAGGCREWGVKFGRRAGRERGRG